MTMRGVRLRAYLLAMTGGGVGWQAELVKKSGVKRQTISKWTSAKFDGYPDPEALADVARALEIRPYEIVAAIDGDGPVAPIDQMKAAAVAEIAAQLPDLLEALGYPPPPRRPRGRADAA
jgi:transcriptional regulator with XRE-family HTH domain